MALTNIAGYPAQVWRQVLATLTYANVNLTPSGQLSAQQQLAEACSLTFRQARDSLDAYGYSQAWAQEYELLAPILTYELGLSTQDQAFVANRITAIQLAAIASASIYSMIFQPVAALSAGTPVVADPMLVEFLMQFSYETIPSDLTTSYPANFQADAEAQYVAWQNCVIALQTQGVSPGQSLDAAQRQVTFSFEAYTAVSNITISALTNPTTTWNRLISMANLCRIGDAYLTDPTTSTAQQINIARLVTMQSLDQFNILVANLDESLPTNVRTIPVRNNDTLVKIAARELGNFELWPSLAALNGLNPPYIGTTPAAGLVVPGASLFIPTGQVSASTIYQPINMQLSYELDYLGTDIYLGPMSQLTMSAWTGDFAIISGYANLANALDRRLITPLTALIYHPEYGSRIPSEVGNIQTTLIAGYLGAYAQSSVLTDPRVASVTDIVVTFPSYGISQVSLTATPNGNTANDVTIASLISPSNPVSQ